MAKIHPTAIVSSDAIVPDEVEIGPYAIVEDDVEIGEGSVLESHSILRSGARIGKSVTVGNFAVVAGPPQDLSFDTRTKTYAKLGDGCVLREGATVHRSTLEGEATIVGKECFIMSQAHVGHDCVVGDKVVLANQAMLAGHVAVGNFCFLGGGCGIHQFCRIGEGVMIGGLARIRLDVAPYTMASEDNCLYGLNLVGLRRRGVDRESISMLQKCYRKVFLGTGKIRSIAEEALREGMGELPEPRRFLEFFASGKRGFVKPRHSA